MGGRAQKGRQRVKSQKVVMKRSHCVGEMSAAIRRPC